jgi:hypothetical protein
LNILNNSNEILFQDLVQKTVNDSNFRNLVTKSNGIQSSYDVEVIPDIPTIKEISIHNNELNSIFLFKSDDQDKVILECKLGTW